MHHFVMSNWYSISVVCCLKKVAVNQIAINLTENPHRSNRFEGKVTSAEMNFAKKKNPKN